MKKYSKGFTLIELVISITIMAILTAITAGLITLGVNSFIFYYSRLTMTRNAQDTMRIMHSKISMAVPSTITNAGATRLRFTTSDNELIDFSYNSTNHTLEYDDSNFNNKQILQDITDFAFSYEKSDAATWVSGDPVSDLKRVHVSFDLTRQNESKTYNFLFFIRN
jgi:prepilin-type N-terminal cleavage/methylation domain-containing protein